MQHTNIGSLETAKQHLTKEMHKLNTIIDMHLIKLSQNERRKISSYLAEYEDLLRKLYEVSFSIESVKRSNKNLENIMKHGRRALQV